MFLRDVSLPVGNDECGQGEGDDETDEAQQRAPHRQREQQNGRVQPHSLAHNLWRYYHVGDYLHHTEESDSQSEHHPEVLSGVSRFKHGKESGRNYGEGVQIRHQIHYSDEYAQTYCHREVHYAEAYAEHHAHAKRNQTLASDVVVEFALDVARQFMPERSVLLGEYLYPIGGEIFVVEQNEEHI